MNGAQEKSNIQKPKPLYEILFESSPDAILVANQDGRILKANLQVEQLFGHTCSELLGQPVEILVPERFRSAHPAHRADYNSQPRMRPMGAGLELHGLRKDGTEFSATSQNAKKRKKPFDTANSNFAPSSNSHPTRSSPAIGKAELRGPMRRWKAFSATPEVNC